MTVRKKEFFLGMFMWCNLLISTSSVELMNLSEGKGIFLTILISVLGFLTLATCISLITHINEKDAQRELPVLCKILRNQERKKLTGFFVILSMLFFLAIVGSLLPKTELARYFLTALLGFSSVILWEFMALYIAFKKT